jgi:hypothetical protein
MCIRATHTNVRSGQPSLETEEDQFEEFGQQARRLVVVVAVIIGQLALHEFPTQDAGTAIVKNDRGKPVGGGGHPVGHVVRHEGGEGIIVGGGCRIAAGWNDNGTGLAGQVTHFTSIVLPVRPVQFGRALVRRGHLANEFALDGGDGRGWTTTKEWVVMAARHGRSTTGTASGKVDTAGRPLLVQVIVQRRNGRGDSQLGREYVNVLQRRLPAHRTTVGRNLQLETSVLAQFGMVLRDMYDGVTQDCERFCLEAVSLPYH